MNKLARIGMGITVGALCAAGSALAQDTPEVAALRAGKVLLETQVYTEAQDLETLARFEGLRVADVRDGMDAVGLQGIGDVSPEIQALWKDTEQYTHRFTGIAVTVRYVPANLPPAGKRATEDFDAWVGNWYQNLSPEPFSPLLRKGSALVIEEAEGVDVGSIGSNNILAWVARGCVGVVTSATARDTDEIITQRVPLYYKGPGRGIRPGRNMVESVNRPVVCGGVLVMPGDVIVADGDGVLVVPRAHAAEVAAYAHKVLDGDKAGRRRLYERLGLPTDDSVR